MGATAGATFPGASGDYASCPDPGAPGADFWAAFYTAATDWTPASGNQKFGSQWGSAGNRAWRFFFSQVTGQTRLSFGITTDGSTAQQVNASSLISPTDAVGLWTGVILDGNNGAGDSDVDFYTSADDGQTALGSVSWSPVGTTQNFGSTVSIFNSSAVFEAGAQGAGTADIFDGIQYRMACGTGLVIGSNVLAHADLYNDPSSPSDTTFTGSGGNTWTLHGNVALIAGAASLIAPPRVPRSVLLRR